MAMNRIHFQHGMSLPEFLRGFGTEAACAQAVMAARWPIGFECPKWFNRRFDLHTLVVRLSVAVARCKPRSEQVIRQAETPC